MPRKEHPRDPNRTWTFTMPEHQAERIHKMADERAQTMKNHICSAVERGDFERAQSLIKDLNEYRALFATFNIAAKYTIAGEKELDTNVRSKLPQDLVS
jgi:hypothetical protein